VTRPLTVMLIAGEASGDNLGAGLAAAIRKRRPDVRFVGVGGRKMAEQGVESPFDIAELSIFGFVDALKAAPRVKRRIAETVALTERENPDAVVLIDSWGYTYRVAKALKARRPDLLLIKYVAPQVWASRPKRADALAKVVDHLLAILPMDLPFFEKAGLPTTFVGNPVLAQDFDAVDPAPLRRKVGVKANDPILLVLPGSRPSEVARLSGPFEDALKRLKQSRPGLTILIGAADTVSEQVRAFAAGLPFRTHLIEDEASRRQAMKAATVALAASGTVSTELALAGAPMVIAYRLGPITHQIVKRIVTTKWATLFNNAAQDWVAPEFLQYDCTGEKLAAAVGERLDDPELRRRQVERQFEALDLMGREAGEPSDRAAETVLGLIGARRA